MATSEERGEIIRDIFNRIRARLDELDEARNKVLNDRRDLLSLCRKAMSLIHSGETLIAKKMAADIKERIKQIEGMCSDKEMFCLISGILRPVKQELVEVEVLLAIIESRTIPSPRDLGVGVISYALGLGDVIGELRREILIAISANKLELAEQLLKWMTILLEEISQLAYPDSLIPIRHKIDVGRSLLDRTFSELLFYKRSSSLV